MLLCTCRKAQDPSLRPIDQLPPATKVGANKAGCLVDGEVFLPKSKNLFGSPVMVCFYQYTNNDWHFGFQYSNDEKTNLRAIGIASMGIELREGQVYSLVAENPQTASATYGQVLIPQYYTNDTITGELTITYLNPSLSIISGTFWFDAVNSEGKVVQVREGRFDMQYSP
jgi:hypothetical protein